MITGIGLADPMSSAPRGAVRVAVLADSTLDGDSRAQRVAEAVRDAGYEVTLIGREADGTPHPRTPRPAGVTVVRVPVPETLHRHRIRRPHPGLRWPLAYRSEDAYRYRTARVAAYNAIIATRTAELDVVHRALPLRAAARFGHACARLRHAVVRGWNALRGAQYLAAARRREHPEGLLDDLTTAVIRLVRGRSCWRRLEPVLLDVETAYGPVLDGLRPHLIHALGHRALGTAVRAALRAEGAGHRIEVVWDTGQYGPDAPAPTRRAGAARDALERQYAPLADGVVTVADSYAAELRRRHSLGAFPAVARNAPPYDPAPRPLPGGGVREACRLAAEVPLLVHSGAVGEARGLLTVVDALPKLYDLHAAFLVPDPHDPYVRTLAERAAELGVDARLHVLPYVPPADLPGFLASADIGVLPVHQLPGRQVALPARYFEYAHARLPIVVSDVRAMANVTLELGNGEVFRARDTADFVRAVGAVLTNPRRYRKAYERADTLRQWSWQVQSAPFVDLYACLLGPDPR
jgi:glycosyltransferase involved in cell wall biosynthesis